MDELTPDELRQAATAANLRRAFGAPMQQDLPEAFAAILARIAARPAEDDGRGGPRRAPRDLARMRA